MLTERLYKSMPEDAQKELRGIGERARYFTSSIPECNIRAADVFEAPFADSASGWSAVTAFDNEIAIMRDWMLVYEHDFNTCRKLTVKYLAWEFDADAQVGLLTKAKAMENEFAKQLREALPTIYAIVDAVDGVRRYFVRKEDVVLYLRTGETRTVIDELNQRGLDYRKICNEIFSKPRTWTDDEDEFDEDELDELSEAVYDNPDLLNMIRAGAPKSTLFHGADNIYASSFDPLGEQGFQIDRSAFISELGLTVENSTEVKLTLKQPEYARVYFTCNVGEYKALMRSRTVEGFAFQALRILRRIHDID